LSLKFQANTYSFERVVTLFVGYYFSSGHRVEHISWRHHDSSRAPSQNLGGVATLNLQN